MNGIVFEFEQQRIFDKWKNRTMITEQKIEECNDILQLKKWDLELRKLIFKNIDERENDILKTLVRFRIEHLMLYVVNLVSNSHESYIEPINYRKSEAQIDFKMNFDQTEKLLNDVLNKAMCRPTRIKNPNSNTVAQFVIDYMNENGLK